MQTPPAPTPRNRQTSRPRAAEAPCPAPPGLRRRAQPPPSLGGASRQERRGLAAPLGVSEPARRARGAQGAPRWRRSAAVLLPALPPARSGARGWRLLLYCLGCAPRGTRGPGRARVQQLRSAPRLPRRPPASAAAASPSSGLATLLPSAPAALPGSPARWAASARRMPGPGLRSPRALAWIALGCAPGRPLAPSEPQSRPPRPAVSPALGSFLPSCPRPPPLRGLGRPLPMRLGCGAVPAQPLYREGGRGGSAAGRGLRRVASRRGAGGARGAAPGSGGNWGREPSLWLGEVLGET